MESKAHILLVDDDESYCVYIEELLALDGFRVLTATSAEAALERLAAEPVSLILSDIAMPGINGYQLFALVNDHPDWSRIPFVFLTARDMDSDIRYGKAMGVDDYVPKSSSREDLLACVRGKLLQARRYRTSAPHHAAPPAPAGDLLSAGGLVLDPQQHRAWRGQEEISLSAREFRLLERLLQRADQIVSPMELVQATHQLEVDYAAAGNLIRPLIRTLRRKLGYPTGDLGCIENVRGIGYRLLPPAG